MSTGTESGGRAYQRLLIDEANAEMGRQRISRRQLMQMTGIAPATMNRIFTCERDMNVAQWESIASALGFDPGELARKAHGTSVTAQRGEDPRTLIQFLMDHPDNDGTLQARLGELRRESGASGRTLAAVEREMVLNRRTELSRALDALPPANSA
jgi:DNA-binding Xre family transcriptional regulator